MCTLLNATTGRLIARRVTRAQSFWARALGLLARAEVARDEGLWIEGCSAIHTMGMRATIDVLFLDDCGLVVRRVGSVAPWRAMLACRGARTVVELGAGALAVNDIALGDRLTLS